MSRGSDASLARPAEETSVRLYVMGHPPEMTTRALERVPDHSWTAGKVTRQGGRPAKTSAWRLQEGETLAHDDEYYAGAVERCLRRLLARIEDPRDFRRRVAALGPRAEVKIVLTGFAREFPNVQIPADLVAKIAALGADIEEDFYVLPAEPSDGPEEGEP